MTVLLDFVDLSLLWLLPANVAVGVLAGLVAGLFGLGGGLIIVPAVYGQLLLLGLADDAAFRIAVTTALANMLPTSIASVRTHYKRRSLQPELARKLAGGLLAGGIVGAAAAPYLNVQLLITLFALVIAISAINNLSENSLVLAPSLPRSWVLTQSMGLAIGVLSVMVGLGGGALTTPLLLLFGVPILHAVGTASLAGLLISTPGVLAGLWAAQGLDSGLPWSYGYLCLPLIAILIPCSVRAAPWGAALAHRLPALVLKKAFALFLLMMAGSMLARAWL